MTEGFKDGDRAVHPNWLGRKRAGTIEKLANRWHADLQFDDFPRTVRAALGSLKPEALAESEETEDAEEEAFSEPSTMF